MEKASWINWILTTLEYIDIFHEQNFFKTEDLGKK